MAFIFGQSGTEESLQSPGLVAAQRTAPQVFGENLEHGLVGTTLGFLARIGNNASTDTEGKPMSESEWEASPYFRKGIHFQPSWTPARAELEADRWDNNYAREYHAAQHPFAAGAGEVTGSLLDPAMLIPFGAPVEAGLDAFKGVKIADSIKNAIEMSRAAKAAEGVVSGAGAEGTFQAARMLYQHSEGQDPDWGSAVLHTAAIAALGGVGGIVAHSFVDKAGIVNRQMDRMERGLPGEPLTEVPGKVGFSADSPTAYKADIPDLPDNLSEDYAQKAEEVDTHVKDYKIAAKIGANCLGL